MVSLFQLAGDLKISLSLKICYHCLSSFWKVCLIFLYYFSNAFLLFQKEIQSEELFRSLHLKQIDLMLKYAM